MENIARNKAIYRLAYDGIQEPEYEYIFEYIQESFGVAYRGAISHYYYFFDKEHRVRKIIIVDHPLGYGYSFTNPHGNDWECTSIEFFDLNGICFRGLYDFNRGKEFYYFDDTVYHSKYAIHLGSFPEDCDDITVNELLQKYSEPYLGSKKSSEFSNANSADLFDELLKAALLGHNPDIKHHDVDFLRVEVLKAPLKSGILVVTESVLARDPEHKNVRSIFLYDDFYSSTETKIGERVFSNNPDLRYVFISASMFEPTNIAESAFDNCPNLKICSLPNSWEEEAPRFKRIFQKVIVRKKWDQ